MSDGINIKAKSRRGDVTININTESKETKKAKEEQKTNEEIAKVLTGDKAFEVGDGFTRSTPTKSDDKAVPEEKPKVEDKTVPKEKPKAEVPEKEKENTKPNPKPIPRRSFVPVMPSHVNNGNNYGTANRQSGQFNINAQNGSTVIINGAPDKTEKAEGIKPDNPENTTPEVPKKQKPDKAELTRIADMIYDSIKGLGTDDDKLDKALKEITADNIVELVETYNKFYPDMFENILDDLSGKKFTAVANKFKDVLLQRLEGTTNYANAQRLAGKIDGELSDKVSYESRIAEWLNGMVDLAKKAEA